MQPPTGPSSLPGPFDLEEWLDRFEEAWQAGRPPELAQFLTGAAPDRLRLLTELIAIDLEHRWRWRLPLTEVGSGVRAAGPLLEDYYASCAELPAAVQASAALIAAEYCVRHRHGDRPGHAEYLTRFPRHGPELRDRLTAIDAELASEFSPPGPPGPATRVNPPGSAIVPTALAVAEVTTTAELIDLLRQYELLRPAQLNELILAELQGQATPLRDQAAELVRRGWLSGYQADLLLSGRAPQLCLGPYLVVEPLGEGGAGQVFHCRHRTMHRPAAVKVIRPALLADDDMVRRFYREVEAVSQLQHPNIVHPYDAGPAGVTHFLAMEFLEGTDLSRLVKKSGPLPVAEAREYIRQAAVGLQHIHERGMVHRDIKPSNLLLRIADCELRIENAGQVASPEDGTAQAIQSAIRNPQSAIVKILDLGLARVRQHGGGEQASTITGSNTTMMGTVDYMAPEQAIDSHAVDIRADIYSLGCTLFYLLTGQPPFPGGTEAEKLVRHQMKPPPDVRSLRPEVPEELAITLTTMLAKDPAHRFATPAELLRALAGEPRIEVAALDTGRLPAALVATDTLSGPIPVAIPAAEPVSSNLARPESKAAPKRRRLLFAGVGAALLLGLGAALLIATLGGGASPGSALKGKPTLSASTREILFQDQFRDENWPTEWRRPIHSSWRRTRFGDPPGLVLEGGVFPEEPKDKDLLLRYRRALQCGKENWTDYAVEVDVQLREQVKKTDHFGVLVLARMQDLRNYCWMEYIFYQRTGEPVIELNRVVGGGALKTQRTSPVPLQLGSWQRLRLEVQGSTMRGYVNGEKYQEVTGSIPRSGGVGFCRADAHDPQGRILWRDVRVEKLPR